MLITLTVVSGVTNWSVFSRILALLVWNREVLASWRFHGDESVKTCQWWWRSLLPSRWLLLVVWGELDLIIPQQRD